MAPPVDAERTGPAPVQGLSFDAAGTLLHPREPVARVYCRLAQEHGVVELDGAPLTDARVARRFAAALRSAPGRQRGDGRVFWQHVVQASLGSSDAALFEALYRFYAEPGAWRWTPGAPEALRRARAAGLRVGLLSNWDARLVELLDALGAAACFDAVCVSGLLPFEKPDPRAFALVAERLALPVSRVLHVGDSLRADVEGARGAGMAAWHFGDTPGELARVLTAAGVAS